MRKTKSDAIFLIRKYIFIFLGTGILSFGIYNIHSRTMITEGGVLGLSLLIKVWFHISPAFSSLVLDIIALIIGSVILRKAFLVDSIIASLLYSLWYKAFEFFPPVIPDVSEYPLLAALLGAIFVGVGTAFIVKEGAAAGADDSIALIFQEKTKLNVSFFYVISDMTVLLLSLTYIPVRKILWSVFTVLLSSGIIFLLTTKRKRPMDKDKSI